MKNRAKIILLTGLFVGTTDILAAYLMQYIKTGNFPEQMYRYIAGGLLGLDRSMGGGPAVGLLGLSIHYVIAMGFTLLFFVVFPYLSFLRYNRYLIGILYGVFAANLMEYVILPLTPLPPAGPLIVERAFVSWLVLGVVLGIPIAHNAYRYYGVDDTLFRR